MRAYSERGEWSVENASVLMRSRVVLKTWQNALRCQACRTNSLERVTNENLVGESDHVHGDSRVGSGARVRRASGKRQEEERLR